MTEIELALLVISATKAALGLILLYNHLAAGWVDLQAAKAKERVLRQRGTQLDHQAHSASGQRHPFSPSGLEVIDNANDWPQAAAAGAIGDEVRTTISSRDQVTAARVETVEKARVWNQTLATFPLNLIARFLFGFRPWQYILPRPSRAKGNLPRRQGRMR